MLLKKLLFTLFLFTFLQTLVFSQAKMNYVWIGFTDKQAVEFDPLEYFDPKAIERRAMHNLPLYDSSDFPVNESYISSVEKIVNEVKHPSRWFNGISAYASDYQIEKVQLLPFVKEVIVIHSTAVLAWDNYTKEDELDDLIKKISIKQVQRFNPAYFEEAGIKGKGVRIAVFDAGFPKVDIHPAFEHIRAAGNIKATYDFVKKKEKVYAYSWHGTNVLSNIAGKWDGVAIGLATEAEFLLARTEMGLREPYSEELNWLAAAEWADKNGANIISSSLGYTNPRYFPHQMDGKQIFVTRAANMAASKGMLVVNAAGNEGSDSWKIIGAPADADSVLTVGGIDPDLDYHISFSSFGPTADGRMKPNVVAYGKVAVAKGTNNYEISFGTSFATPLVSGFAACAWQAHRNLKNMELFKEIEQSGDLYPYFDYAHGFGVPQADYFKELDKEHIKTFSFVPGNFTVDIVIANDYYKKVSEDEVPLNIDELIRVYKNDDFLYYHIEKPDGKLMRYAVVRVEKQTPLNISLAELSEGKVLRVFYKGYAAEFKK
jgi:serine protease AprX